MGVTAGIPSTLVTGGFSCVLDGVASFLHSSSEMLVGEASSSTFPRSAAPATVAPSH